MKNNPTKKRKSVPPYRFNQDNEVLDATLNTTARAKSIKQQQGSNQVPAKKVKEKS